METPEKAKYISIVIPNRNNAKTIGKTLETVFASQYKNFEVIVVDDCSEDSSTDVIRRFPAKLIALHEHSGAAKARNTGAQNSTGDVIFFTDADCMLKKETLSIVNAAIRDIGLQSVIGGTYTKIPYDKDFFSTFQSLYIHYSETKNTEDPDYIATHAMIIDADTFRKNNGFPEDFMPILEDVEFSHRLRRSGCRLVMNPEIQVQHIFNFNLWKSLKNAFKKSKYWIMYSLYNKDLSADSGTASVELKVNGFSYILSLLLLLMWIFSQKAIFLYFLPVIFLINSYVNRGLLNIFYETKGPVFTLLAFLYYTMLYPLAVLTGAISGTMTFFSKKGKMA
jgi:glycosyltransferase involved in cell wall biosynthesis